LLLQAVAGPSAPGTTPQTSLFALPAILLVTLFAWGAVPWGTFQFDDLQNVVLDPATTELSALLERLPHGLRPLTRLSYFIDAQLFGMRPAGFLATNLLLHVITTALVFALARRRLSPLAAILAALFFALQPANAEVVAYVSGRSTGLMTPLLLGGLLLHDRGQRPAAYVLFALACLAKEVALVFPLLLLAWEVTRERPRPLRESAIAMVFAGLLCAALLTLESYQSMISWSLAFRSVGENLLANGRAIPVMLSLWVRPWALSPDHDFDAAGHLVTSVIGLACLAVIAVLAIRLRRRQPLIALALLWPLVALLPTNSIIAKIDLVTEKPLYLAWVGIAMALGAGVAAMANGAVDRKTRTATLAMTVLFAMVCASWWRASLWRDPVSLWTDAVAQAPQKSRCWNNLGMAYLVARRDAEAVAAFQQSVMLDPLNESARTNLYTAQTLCGSGCRAELVSVP